MVPPVRIPNLIDVGRFLPPLIKNCAGQADAAPRQYAYAAAGALEPGGRLAFLCFFTSPTLALQRKIELVPRTNRQSTGIGAENFDLAENWASLRQYFLMKRASLSVCVLASEYPVSNRWTPL